MPLPSRRPDRSAQMPFALIAVLLVVIGGSSLSLIALIQDSGGAAEQAEADMESMRMAISSAQALVEEGALGVLAAVSAHDPPGGLEGYQAAFRASMDRWVSHYFPLRVGGHVVHMEDVGMALGLRHLNLLDGDAYDGALPMNPVVAGSYRLHAYSARGSMEQTLEIERGSISPLPFLIDRMDRMSLSMEGSRSDLAQLVTQQLSSLAQVRALQGYGLQSVHGARGSAAMLTEGDVHLAIENALSILEARAFRSVDSGIPSLDGMPRQELVDPAALMLSASWDGSLELSEVLSQALASILDRLALQWLSYLHIDGVIDVFETFVDGAVNFYDGMVEGVWGASGSPAVGLLRDEMSKAGYSEASYRHIYRSTADLAITVPAFTHEMASASGGVSHDFPEITFVLDLPAVDIFEWPGWKGFTIEYRKQTDEIMQEINRFIKGVCDSVASTYGMGALSIDLDPHSGVPVRERLMEAMRESLRNDQAWLKRVLDLSMDRFRSLDGMSGALAAYVEENWRLICCTWESFHAAQAAIEKRYAQELKAAFGHAFSYSDRRWLDDAAWLVDGRGISDEIARSVERRARMSIDPIVQVLEGAVRPGNPLCNAIAHMASWGVGLIPGVDKLLMTQMERVMGSIGGAGALQGDAVVELAGSPSFLLQDSDGRFFLQTLEVSREADLSAKVLGFSSDRAFHHVGFDSPAFSPFSCTIEVEIAGSVRHSLSSREDPMSLWSLPAEHSRESSVSTRLRIPVQTAWPILGVSYTPSNTLAGDAGRMLLSSAGGLLGPLSEGFQAADQVFSSLSGIMIEASGFATDAMLAMSDAVLAPVLRIREALEGAAGEALESLGGLVQNMGSLRFKLDLMGMELLLETNVFELALGLGKNLVKGTLTASVGDTIFSVSLQLLQASNMEVYALIGASMATDRWSASLVIDPFMRVHRHLVEVKGQMEGHGFEVYLPQVTQYESFRVAISEMPGLGAMLSNIPLPVPGLKGSIDAGFDIKYNLPFSGNVVINEVEMNPPGTDSGNEWVELYNPLDRDVSISGWSVTSGQAGNRHDIGQGYLPAGGRMLVRFQGQFLNNGGGTRIPQGECAKLWDAQGRLVDSSPWRSDYYNDGRTWQREFDGSDRWVFKEGTMGYSNGKGSTGISSQKWLKSQISSAFMQAFAEYGDSFSDVDGVAEVLRRTVELVAHRAIDTVAESLVECSFFLRMGVTDLSSSAHGGLELSILIGPDFVREGLRWVFDSMLEIVCSVGSPAQLASPSFLTEHVHIRLAAFSAIGPPKFLMLLEKDMTLELQAMVQVNLDGLGKALGLPAANPVLGFGVVLRNVPGAALPSIMSVDNEKTADIWLVRGSIDLSSNGL